jgi:hypothetical protein
MTIFCTLNRFISNNRKMKQVISRNSLDVKHANLTLLIRNYHFLVLELFLHIFHSGY